MDIIIVSVMKVKFSYDVSIIEYLMEIGWQELAQI